MRSCAFSAHFRLIIVSLLDFNRARASFVGENVAVLCVRAIKKRVSRGQLNPHLNSLNPRTLVAVPLVRQPDRASLCTQIGPLLYQAQMSAPFIGAKCVHSPVCAESIGLQSYKENQGNQWINWLSMIIGLKLMRRNCH